MGIHFVPFKWNRTANMKLLFIVLSVARILDQRGNAELVYQWKGLDYRWPSPEDKQAAIESKTYIESTNVASGLAAYKGRVYLALPRIPGVPVTVASVSQTNSEQSPKLEPYPNWKMQKNGSCSAFYSAQDLDIDNNGRMWIVDSGEYGSITDPTQNYM